MATAQLARTVGQLIIRTRRYIKQPDEAVSHWDNDFIRQVLNSQYRLRCTELHLAHEGHFQNVSFRDIEALKARYEWPPGFTRLLKLELVRADGRVSPIQRYERRYESNPVSGAYGQDSYYCHFRPISGGFVLEPAPQVTVSQGLRMEYNGIPSEIVDDGDVLHPDFPEIFDELLVLDTVVGLMHAEELQEAGLQRTFMTWRTEWEVKWLRYIDDRITSQQGIVPFVPHYRDS